MCMCVCVCLENTQHRQGWRRKGSEGRRCAGARACGHAGMRARERAWEGGGVAGCVCVCFDDIRIELSIPAACRGRCVVAVLGYPMYSNIIAFIWSLMPE